MTGDKIHGCQDIQKYSVDSVLLTTDYLPPSSGGVERVVTELALELDKLGVDVTILSLEDGSKEFQDSEVTVRSVPSLDLTELLGAQARVSPLFPLMLIWQLFSEDFDTVHSHNRFFFSTWMTAFVLWLFPSPPPFVTTVHLGDVSNLDGVAGSVAQIIEKTIGRIVFNQSKAVIGVSDAALDSVTSLTGDSLTATVYNGVDADTYKPNFNLKKDSDPFEILFIGRIIDNKGIFTLLNAVSNLDVDREWTLTIVGEGPLRSRCQKFVVDQGLGNRVEFKGFVPSIPEVMQSADVFCRPSKTEGLPLTLLEAMAFGLPPVVTPVGGVKEVVDSGKNGIIVSSEPTEICVALSNLIKNKEQKERIGKAARKTVLSDYSWSSRANSVFMLYQQVNESMNSKS